ncbi:MAG: NfeD family protein [Bacilli bacterium]|nr:NfeD family protein [Bacilli bacterium]
MSSIWMIIFVALAVFELITINLVSIWFAIGALASFTVSLVSSDTTLQIAVFVIVSFITLVFTKSFVKRIRTKDPIPTNLDRVIGKIGVVTEEITKLNPGEVKVDGKRWTAVANKKINVGSKVEILSIEGVKLSVKEVKEED